MAFERRILTTYDASTAGFDRGTRRVELGLSRLERTTNQRLTSIDRRFERASRSALRVGTAIGAILGVAGGAAAIRGVKGYSEAWRGVERSLSAAGFAIEGNREKLARLAIRVRGDFQSAGAAVSRFARVTGDDLDISIRRVETLRKLLSVGGASTQEAASASLQLTQGLRSGRLGGEELRSISENAPIEFLDALAKRAGGARSELKKLGADGKLTADVITGALDDLAASADAQFAKLAISGTEAAEILSTGFTTFFGRLDEQFGATAGLNEFLVETGTFLANDAEAAATFAKALEIAAVAAASLAGGKALGAVNRSLSAGSVARKLAVTQSAQLVATTQAEIQKQRELVVVRGQAFTLATRTARTAKQVERARASLTAANVRLTAAETQAAAAANAHAIAQGRLSLATRVTSAAMATLRGTLAFFGGIPGLILAAVSAAVLFTDVLKDQSDRLEDLAGKLDSVQSGITRVRDVEQQLEKDTQALTAANEQLETAIEAQQGAATDTARIEIDAINRRIAKNKELKAEYEVLLRAQLAIAEQSLSEERTSFRRSLEPAVRRRVFENRRQGERLPEDFFSPEAIAARQDAEADIRRSAIRAAQDAGETLSDADVEFLETSAALAELQIQTNLTREALENLAKPVEVDVADTSGGGTAGRTKALQDLIDASRNRQAQLQGEIALERVNSEEKAFAEEKLRLLTEAAREGIEIGAQEIALIDQNARAYAVLSQELDDVRAAKEVIASVTEREATLEERILAANERLAGLLPTIIALIGDEAEARRILNSAMEDSEAKIRETAGATDEWADALGNALGRARSLEDGLKSLAAELLKLAANDFFRSLLGAPDGGTSIFSTLGTSLASLFHEGGTAGDAAPSRRVPSALFANAPRYHNGSLGVGLAPNEIPAILERGEVVVPNGAELSSGVTSITINQPISINQPGASPAQIQAIVTASSDRAIQQITQKHALSTRFLQD